MKVARAVCSLVQVVAFACCNTQALDAHVHEARHGDPDHHQAVAFHHHDDHIDANTDSPALRAVDADDTVVAVRICATSQLKVAAPTATVTTAARVEPVPGVALVRSHVIARAHGPPSSCPTPLRSPPFPASL